MTAGRSLLFLSCPPDHGRRIVENVRARWPEARWLVFVRGGERDAYGVLLDGLDVHSPGRHEGRLGLVRMARRERAPRGVVVWAGHGDRWRMKVAALLSRTPELHAYNENLDAFDVREIPPVLVEHVRWRLRSRGGGGALRTLVTVYTWTVGLVLGHAWLLFRWALWSCRRALHRPRGA